MPRCPRKSLHRSLHVRCGTCNILVEVGSRSRARAGKGIMERGPEDRREGSQRSDESTRRGNAVGIGEGAFVGALAGGTLGVALVGNVYLASGSGRRSVRFSEV